MGAAGKDLGGLLLPVFPTLISQTCGYRRGWKACHQTASPQLLQKRRQRCPSNHGEDGSQLVGEGLDHLPKCSGRYKLNEHLQLALLCERKGDDKTAVVALLRKLSHLGLSLFLNLSETAAQEACSCGASGCGVPRPRRPHASAPAGHPSRSRGQSPLGFLLPSGSSRLFSPALAVMVRATLSKLETCVGIPPLVISVISIKFLTFHMGTRLGRELEIYGGSQKKNSVNQ